MQKFSYVEQKHKKHFGRGGCLAYFSVEEISKALTFHKTFPSYRETDLRVLRQFSKHAGLRNVYLKDESSRFEINSFKGLGASFAMGSYIAQRLNLDLSDLPYERMISDEVREALGEITFVSCTDGNHGRGVAWVGQMLKQKVKIYMPKGSSSDRVKNIEALGAEVTVTDLNYDDTIRKVRQLADEKDWVIIQDTSWEGYEDIPKWIMQGYSAMVLESYLQIERAKLEKPTHVFLQAGVGAMAGGACGLIVNLTGEDMPKTIIVEPNNAACYLKSALADDGQMHFVTGDMETIMAGLACGEPGTIAFDIIHEFADGFISCPDYVTANGMRILANPLSGDDVVISGTSGAVTFGLTNEIATNKQLKDLKEKIGLNEQSVVLCISTEGDTDKKEYEDVIWYGKYSKFYE